MTLPYGGCKGGFVVVVADDPNAHYSSTEQDTRVLAAYAEIPCLEPEDQQEAKDMARAAFDISESLELPVFLRSVSRISHARGDVLFRRNPFPAEILLLSISTINWPTAGTFTDRPAPCPNISGSTACCLKPWLWRKQVPSISLSKWKAPRPASWPAASPGLMPGKLWRSWVS